MDELFIKERLKEILCNEDGIQGDVAEEYALTLAYSLNKAITQATEELLHNAGARNVRFAGACNTFLIQNTYGISYLQALAFAEDVLIGLEHSARCGEHIVIEKTNGERIVFEPKVYDSCGKELPTERRKSSEEEERVIQAFFRMLDDASNPEGPSYDE